ncbi:MAG: secondary thiamine-phosphate synthase enzyme YjbQ [Schleiferiaceae bacterium]|jgi:secondary thiamine-phosphate synthase enzyme|nr:secondary thiamine-phosphate synthase enzyme YjbQ [Schleiferiaceae bacterium]
MVQHFHLELRPFSRGFHLITEHITQVLPKLPKDGVLQVFIKHTSAGLTINENYDPSVRTDFNSIFDKLVKENEPYYTHTLEGSDDIPAHIKTALVGTSVQIPIVKGRLELGTWQGIYLCEFRDRGGARNLVVSVIS